MEEKVSIKKNFIYNCLAQLFTVITPFITSPYLARVLKEDGVGKVSYTASIIAFFTLFAGLGFSIYGQREVARNKQDYEKKSCVFWEITILKFLSTFISIIIFVLIFFTVGFGDKYNKLILAQGIALIAVVFDSQFLFQGDEDFKTIAIRTMLIRIIGIAAIFIFVRSENDILKYILLNNLIILFSNVILVPSILKKISFINPKKLKFRRHLKPILIIFIPTVITTVFTTFDKAMIGWLSTNPDYDNGCYDQAYKINSLAQSITVLYSNIMLSRNSLEYAIGNEEEMNKNILYSCKYAWFTSMFLTVGFILLSKNFCTWFLGDGYVEVPLLLIIMSLRLLVSPISVELGNRFVIIGKEKYWLISVFIGAICNIVVNFFLIPKYGAIGAAIATTATEILILLSMIIFTIMHKGFDIKKIFLSAKKYFISAIIAGIIVFFFSKLFKYSIMSFLLIGTLDVFAYIGTLFLLKDELIIGIFKNFKQLIYKKVKRNDH